MAECSDSIIGFPPAAEACTCANLGGGGTVNIPNPLPVTFDMPPAVTNDVLITHIEGAFWDLWPENVVSWSVTVEEGTAILVGVNNGGNTELHTGDWVGDGVEADFRSNDTVAHPIQIDARNGRVLLNVQSRP